MILPQFIRFYSGYTVGSAMNEYAITFFSLVNSMFRMQANETLTTVQANIIPNMNAQDAKKAIEVLQKDARGIHGIVQEVRMAKR